MMQYYFRDSFEAEEVGEFDQLTLDYPYIRFFQPSPEKAPWHVQAFLDTGDAEPIVLNFWPHKTKGQRQGAYSVEGMSAIRGLIEEALRDQSAMLADSTAFDLIEE